VYDFGQLLKILVEKPGGPVTKKHQTMSRSAEVANFYKVGAGRNEVQVTYSTPVNDFF
jgi:hypothetical protein